MTEKFSLNPNIDNNCAEIQATEDKKQLKTDNSLISNEQTVINKNISTGEQIVDKDPHDANCDEVKISEDQKSL